MQAERQEDVARRHADVLLAIHHVSHGAGFPTLAGVEVPEELMGLGVGGHEGAVAIAVEDQAAGSRHQAAAQDAAADIRNLPGHLAGLNIDGLEEFAAGFAGSAARASAVERLAGLPPLVVLAVDVAGLLGKHIKKAGGRVVGIGGPVGGASHRGTDQLAFDGGRVAGQEVGPSVRADAARPGDPLDEGLGQQEFAGEPVQHVKEAVAVALHQQLAGLAVEGGVHQHRSFGGVPIVQVMGCELVIPAEFSAGRVERRDGRSIKVIALALVAVVVRARIADGPIEQVSFGVVGAGEPRGAAAVFEGPAGPGFGTRLAGGGDGPEAPDAAAGGGVVIFDQEYANDKDAKNAAIDSIIKLLEAHKDGVSKT